MGRVLITGAAGKTGRALVRQWAAGDDHLRALVRSPDQAGALLAAGASEAVAVDLLDYEGISGAMEGIRKVYHICPNVHPAEVEIGDSVISAARAAGVEHFVFHSVLYPDVEAMPHHWLKFEVEQILRASGVAFTILRPCAYMQNSLAQLPSMLETGTLQVPYDVEARFSVVDLRDVAAAARKVLSETGHEGRTYELCGPEEISHRGMARAFGAALGRPVRAVAVDASRWERDARSSGLGDYAVDALVKMFRWYDVNGFVGSPADLERLLERPGATCDEFARETAPAP